MSDRLRDHAIVPSFLPNNPIPRICGFVTIRWEGKVWLCERSVFEEIVSAGALQRDCVLH